jgi:TolA-binding protein
MSKLSAAYWVGLMSFDDGKFAVAQSWLSRPELTAADSPWAFGATYNLARALEAQGKYDAAIAILEKDTSPQAHGNKLRARALRSAPKPAKVGE